MAFGIEQRRPSVTCSGIIHTTTKDLSSSFWTIRLVLSFSFFALQHLQTNLMKLGFPDNLDSLMLRGTTKPHGPHSPLGLQHLWGLSGREPDAGMLDCFLWCQLQSTQTTYSNVQVLKIPKTLQEAELC